MTSERGSQKPHLKYLVYVLKHKWFVLRAGLKTGVPLWRLIIHDYTKFSRAEWTPYVQKFYGNWGSADSLAHADAIQAAVNEAFSVAWLHHYKRNPHHWNYWLGTEQAQEMPETYVREMVADWMGAGRAITGKWETAEWYAKRRDSMKLHPNTRFLAEALLTTYCGWAGVTPTPGLPSDLANAIAREFGGRDE